MAGVSTKEIKNRIRSMQSTRQITKAMELVAASKLRKAQDQVNASRPYFLTLRETIDSIMCANREFSSPYLKEREGDRVLYVVIGGDRGLAGGYNSNVYKLVLAQAANAAILPMGKRVMEYFRSQGNPIYRQEWADAAQVSVADCFTIAKQLCRSYREGEFDRICVVYTNFVSVLSQVPATLQLLPLQRPRGAETPAQVTLYEPDSETVFDTIVSEYLGGVLYGALCESRASEQAARRTAMDAATKNADEMIEDLSLRYNRARQAAITQEITEIVAGAKRS